MEAEGRPKEGRLRRWFGKLKFWGRGKGIDKGTEKLLRLAYEKVNEHYSTYKLIGGDPGFEPKYRSFEELLKDEEAVQHVKKSKMWERLGWLSMIGGSGLGIGIAITSALAPPVGLIITPVLAGIGGGVFSWKKSSDHYEQLKEKIKIPKVSPESIGLDKKTAKYLELAHKSVVKEAVEHIKRGHKPPFAIQPAQFEEVLKNEELREAARKVSQLSKTAVGITTAGGVGSIIGALTVPATAGSLFFASVLGPAGLATAAALILAAKSNRHWERIKRAFKVIKGRKS